MADSKISIAKTLINEGGYVDNPNDSGGPTKYGITQKDMPGVNIQDITPEQATEYYQDHYWKALYSQIDSQVVADKLFDMGVLFGVGEAVKLLQIVLTLTADTIFGPHTLEAVNQADPGSLLTTYKTALVNYVIGIANDRPQDRVFLTGWIRRINS
jgi:lysozyme family protein